jgi:hypothetical protein
MQDVSVKLPFHLEFKNTVEQKKTLRKNKYLNTTNIMLHRNANFKKYLANY